MVWVFYGWGTQILRFSGRLLVHFFLACQAAWLFVALEPSLDCGDAPASLADKKLFWLLGFAFLIPGLFARVVGALRPTRRGAMKTVSATIKRMARCPAFASAASDVLMPSAAIEMTMHQRDASLMADCKSREPAQSCSASRSR
jgi:UPF0716 family protein affecting phage T7 exclusion